MTPPARLRQGVSPHRIHILNLMIASLAALAGCSSIPPAPDSSAPPVAQVPHAWSALPVIENRRALGGSAAESSLLSSEEVLAAAIAFNPRMKLARAQRDFGAAGILVAQERVNPTLSLSPEHLLEAASGVSPWVLAVSIVWPMRTAAKRDLAIEQALAAGDSASLNAAAVVWSLRTDARTRVCAIEVAWARRALANEEAALRNDLTARFEKQAEAGIVSRYEVARARLDRDAASQRLQQADADVIAARHDLSAITGLPMSEIELRNTSDTCLAAGSIREPVALKDLETTAIASRLDLRAKLAEFRGVDAAWRTEIARRYPDIAFGPGYMYDQGDRKLTFSLSFELPLHSHNAGAIARARSERDRVAAEAEILADAVIAEVDKAYDQFLQARARLESVRSLLQEAQAILDRDTQRERAGELDRPAILISRIAMLSARTDELTAASAVLDAAAVLEAASQTPLAAPEFNTDAASALLETP